ncbi:MAG: phosphoglycerate dehydrogenase, partial [Planctomycetales bacterium]|nr:phosphoglycerate dehydrogenase [Planctomycetales bacterium]
MEPRTVLVADSLPPVVGEILGSEPSIRVVVKTGLPEEALVREMRGVAGLVVRSATKVTAPILESADRLELVVRAGTGVDNIDVEAATRRGVVVMNVPGENTVSAAEHTLALLLSLVRKVPAADGALKAGRWERGLQGTELQGKTLGLVGCGRVGKEVAARAAAFGMRVIAHDPYLPEETARRMGVTLADLPALLSESDVVSIHAPLTDSTRKLLGRPEIAQMRPGAILVNCARGGLVDEEALAEALAAGRIGGAALDVFEKEPPGATPLVASPKTVCTPHLGASTSEAQERVARRTAEQVLAFFRTGAAENAVNVPGVPTGAWPRLAPWVGLAERL